MKISDNHDLLTQSQIEKLQQGASEFFQLGGCCSLYDLLDDLDVDVMIKPGIHVRPVPTSLAGAEEFWLNEAKRIERESHERKNAEEEYSEAKRKSEEARRESELYAMMPLRGLYNPSLNVIELYPEEMETEYDGLRMDELLLSTLIHETMHAYFNRYPKNRLPYVYFVEEPLAEFGMLLYLQKIHSPFLQWAYDDVSNKKTCYRYGAALLDQTNNGDEALWQYLESFRVRLNDFAMLHISQCGGTITMPEPIRQVHDRILVNGTRLPINWNNVFTLVTPRYFYDDTTKTFGLDGDWSEDYFWNSIKMNAHFMDVYDYIDLCYNEIQNVYLGEDFTLKGCCLHILHNMLSKVPVVVSPWNKELTAIDGIPVFKRDGKPALPRLRYEYYKIYRNGKYGVIDDKLNEVVPCIYDDICKIDKNGLFKFAVETDDGYLYGLVDCNGVEQTPPIHNFMEMMNGEYVTFPTAFDETIIDEDEYQE